MHDAWKLVWADDDTYNTIRQIFSDSRKDKKSKRHQYKSYKSRIKVSINLGTYANRPNFADKQCFKNVTATAEKTCKYDSVAFPGDQIWLFLKILVTNLLTKVTQILLWLFN